MELRDEFLEILKRISGRNKISSSCYLYHDFGIIGDDADELFEEIEKKFSTKFDGFVFHEYFPDEYGSWPLWLMRLFRCEPKQKKLSVGHLLAVVERGHWFPPDEE